MFDDTGKSDYREVLAEPGPIKLERSEDGGDMKLCFSVSSKLNHYCMWRKYTFEHQKIVKNPAFVRNDLIPEHWRRLHSKIRSKQKICDEI